MPDPIKFVKSSPKMVGAVLIALVTIIVGGGSLYSAIDKIPYATKTQVKMLEEKYDHHIEDLKQKDIMLVTFKNAGDKWYLELNQEVAVLRSQMTRVEKQLDRIEGLLMGRR